MRCAFATILILMRMVQPRKSQRSDDVDGVTMMHVALCSKEEKDMVQQRWVDGKEEND